MASWVDREEKGEEKGRGQMHTEGGGSRETTQEITSSLIYSVRRRGEERRGEERRGEERRERRGEERRGEERRGEERRPRPIGVTEACQVIMFLDPGSIGL
ncbi:hypothetical protein D4764_12G0008260 [Takifugu flavidus]|uniref:Uncharacterized protein n=1 Tax=Takifugu flavidus TaxID=433684 RepID=A0A5C6PE25_9TELE|nr:hypothetical protein D4764_12G0008260 [Takifugu flavidus]